MWSTGRGYLTHFDATGNVTFVPNPTYSGRVKPTLKKFSEVPFTSDTVAVQRTGGWQGQCRLPACRRTSPHRRPRHWWQERTTRGCRTSPWSPLYTWSINYFPYNFNSTGDGGNAGKIFSQLYFRQAVQYLVDQPQYISKLSHGYGVGTYGPVPLEPQNAFVSTTEKGNPYPYNPSKAKSLLSSHGWKVVPNGTSTCQKPGSGAGQCGAGIPTGAKLAFNLQYVGGVKHHCQHDERRKVQLGPGRHQDEPQHGFLRAR